MKKLEILRKLIISCILFLFIFILFTGCGSDDVSQDNIEDLTNQTAYSFFRLKTTRLGMNELVVNDKLTSDESPLRQLVKLGYKSIGKSAQDFEYDTNWGIAPKLQNSSNKTYQITSAIVGKDIMGAVGGVQVSIGTDENNKINTFRIWIDTSGTTAHKLGLKEAYDVIESSIDESRNDIKTTLTSDYDITFTITSKK